MLLRPDQQKVHRMLSEAIAMLCRNGLEFSEEFTVEGLLGITLDSKEVFLVNIKEHVLSDQNEANVTQSSSSITQDNTARESEQRSPHFIPGCKQRCKEGIISCPLTPMMQQCGSPFRRQRGRRRFHGEWRGLRRRMNGPHFRFMQAMLSGQHHGASNPLDELDQELGLPPFPKRPHLSTGPPTLTVVQPESTTVSSESRKDDSAEQDMPDLTKVKVEPESDFGVSETGAVYQKNEGLGDFSDGSSVGSPWHKLPFEEDEWQARSRTPSSVGTADNESDLFDDYIDPAILSRIKMAIMKRDGCFVTPRMLCRRYSTILKSHLVVQAMRKITVPVGDPEHIGMLSHLKERNKVFFKCPPDQIKPETLKKYDMTMEQYQESFYKMPRTRGMFHPRRDFFIQSVMECSPYGPMKPEEFEKIIEESIDPDPQDSMDEFELQHFIVHSEGCFVSSRILCRRLSKQYKVVHVIRAMKAMSRHPTDPNYIGQFVRVSERVKIFFKAPPDLVGATALQTYGLTAEQYKCLYYASPHPSDGSVTNWDSYVENIASRYPYSFENFPLESCEVSPDIADRIKSMFSAGQAQPLSSFTGGISSFLDILEEQDDVDTQDTVDKIRNMFGSDIVSSMSASVAAADTDPNQTGQKGSGNNEEPNSSDAAGKSVE